MQEKITGMLDRAGYRLESVTRTADGGAVIHWAGSNLVAHTLTPEEARELGAEITKEE